MTDSYIALDLETTGLEPKKEKITEIAALKVEHGQITGRFVTLVNPKRPLTERVVELTGITDDMLKDAPVIEDIIGEVLEFIGNLPLLGHNIRFDYSFLKQAAVNQKMEFECEAVDTLKVCRKLMPEQEKKNLQEMADDHTMVETSEGSFEWTQEMTAPGAPGRGRCIIRPFPVSEAGCPLWRRTAGTLCDNPFKLPDEAAATGNEKAKRILAGFIKMS